MLNEDVVMQEQQDSSVVATCPALEEPTLSIERKQPVLRRAGERGVALLMVITVLVTLVILAVAFAPHMERGRQRTETKVAAMRAQSEAIQVAQLIRDFLQGSHPANEAKAAMAGAGRFSTPRWDSLRELTPGDDFRRALAELRAEAMSRDPVLAERLAWLKERGLGPLNDDGGSIWSVDVQDAQACINVNGSSPYLLANLLGSATLSEDLDGGSTTINVEHVAQSVIPGLAGFPAENGYIRIGREVISYERFDGAAFEGCERATLTEVPLQDNGSAGTYKKGTPVIAYEAWKIATHIVANQPGQLTYFKNRGPSLQTIGRWGGGISLSPDRLHQIRPFLTAHSRRETADAWQATQLSLTPLGTEEVDEGEPDEIRVRDGQNPAGTSAYVSAGAIVRLRDGRSTAYQAVLTQGNIDGRHRWDRFTLAGPASAGTGSELALEFRGGETEVGVYAPYPININTAPREVLFAVMAHLARFNADDEESIVTPKLALAIADRIIVARRGPLELSSGSGGAGTGSRRLRGPFRSAEDWGRFLDALLRTDEVSAAQRDALYTNAINPRSNRLKFGTAPWCFRSLDVYHVESRVAINNRGGEQIASHSIREVVEIGSDAVTTWDVDSQAEFEERVQSGSGAKFVASFPFRVNFRNNGTHHIEPALRAPQHMQTQIYPSASVSSRENGEDVGDVRLEPARLRLPGPQFVEHFDRSTYTHGWYTDYSGAYRQGVAGTLRGPRDDYVTPFAMSFWWRPYSDANWTAFDCGMDRFMNRYAIFVTESDQGGQELVFRVCGPTLEQRAAEVYVPLDRLAYEAGNWYHIQVSCVGEDPSTMQLLVDGLDIAERRGVARLEQGIAAEDTDITVDNTDGFPPFGAIKIGQEIIEYEQLSGTSFIDCGRGERGTAARDWPAGTPVRLLGYSLPIMVDVKPGGSYLEEQLGRFSAMRIYGVFGGNEQYQDRRDLEINNVPISIGGYETTTTNFTAQATTLWGQDETTALEAFGTEGIALVGCPRPNFNVSEAGGGGGGGGLPGAGAPDDGPPEGEGPESGGDTFPGPGGGVPPGSRDPSDPPGGGDPGSGNPGSGDPGSGDPGSGDPGSGDPGSGSGGNGSGNSATADIGGWELVYYRRDGNTFTIERFHASAWQAAAEPYFLMTHVVTTRQDFPCYIVPISVMGSRDTDENGYLDPSRPEDEEVLTRYGGDASARVALGTDNPAGRVEVIKYDSIDRSSSQSGILFVRDRELNNIVSHFYGQTVDVDGGGSSETPEEPLPEDEPPAPEPEPEPPTPEPGPGDNPENPEDPGGDTFPGPGGGVPPGLRDPSDPPGTGDPGTGDPGTGDPGTGDPGTGDPGTGDPGTGDPGTGDPGTGDDEGDSPMPGDPENPEEGGDEFDGPGGSIDPGERDPGDDGDSGSGDGGSGGGDGGGSDGGGGGDTGGGDEPPETEPTPDDSGEGEPETDEGEFEGPGGSVPPGMREPPPEEPADSEGEATDGSWDPELEPAGPETARLRLDMRGVNGTVDIEHRVVGDGAKEAAFLPCFKVWEGHSGALDHRAGRNDRITLTFTEGDETFREEGLVRWGDPNSNWMCLDDFSTTRTYAAPEEGADTQRHDQRGRPRILKFPCGELPDEMPEEMEFGRSSLSDSGVVKAFLDELHIWRHTVGPVGIVVDPENDDGGITADASEILLVPNGPSRSLQNVPGMDRECGVFMLDDEVIIYRGTRAEGETGLWLENCVRGALGSVATFHAQGGYGRFITNFPVSYLPSPLNAEANSIPLQHTRGWPQEGTVRIIGEDSIELAHYTRRSGTDLIMPQSLDADDYSRQRGLFRGRFGTEEQEHPSGSIVIFQPYRYWDRYAERRSEGQDTFSGVHDHPETSYLELGLSRRDAWWHGLRWSENLDDALSGSESGSQGGGRETPYHDILVLARFNKNVAWDSKDVVDMRKGRAMRQSGLQRDPTKLYIFDDPEEANRLGFESTTAQFRVYYKFGLGAYVGVDLPQAGGPGLGNPREDLELQNAWKKTPWLRSLTVTYVNRTKAVVHQSVGKGQ